MFPEGTFASNHAKYLHSAAASLMWLASNPAISVSFFTAFAIATGVHSDSRL